ncbi:MAG: uroporphyrinogen decarboxylase [Alphaproteobacteria bacterium]
MVTTQKSFLDVLAGHKPNRLPFWFMRQAGRYLPEYRELRAKAGSFLDLAYNPDFACEVTLQPIRRFGMDAAIIFSDILVIPHALGQDLKFVEGEGPKLNALRESSDFSKLNFNGFEKTLSPVYEALRKTSSALQEEGHHNTALIGFCGAPWTVACYMVEGGGSRDFMNVRGLSYSDPIGFAGLIDLLVESSAQYLINQIEAGAEAVQIFDSWAGALDAQSFRKWVIQPTKQIVDLVRNTYPDVPIIGFPRCAGQNYLSYVQDTGVTAVGLDQSVDTRWAARTLQTLVPVQGNLDPVCLHTGGDALILAAEKIIGDLSNGNFIFNLGHGIHKDTPIEHVELLVKIIREYQS